MLARILSQRERQTCLRYASMFSYPKGTSRRIKDTIARVLYFSQRGCAKGTENP
jgi:hypothetical protein